MGSTTFKDTVGLVLITGVGGFDYSREDLEVLFDITFSLYIQILKEVTSKLALVSDFMLCFFELKD